jgi:hypothetical protein
LKVLGNNLRFALVVVILQTSFSLLFATFLLKNTKTTIFLRVVYFFPTILSSVSVGLIWLFLYNPNYGLINATAKKVGLVLAGNIPRVGFHDILSVLITGHEAHIKLSSQDQQLIPMLLEKLISLAPELKNKIFYPERLNAVDAVIATGSDNSARYFEYYFGNKPHIIRKNRNSIAVLSGNETSEEINILGKDIFQYFGLGCRNVSKIYIPKNYDLTFLLAHLEFIPIYLQFT